MWVEVRNLAVEVPEGDYSRSPKVGNSMPSILKCNVKGIPALFDLNPVSNFLGLTSIGTFAGPEQKP